MRQVRRPPDQCSTLTTYIGYTTYLATHAHMDVTAFNMHFPAGQFRLQFGSKGDQRSFHAERCDTLSWLYYTMSMQTLLSATLVYNIICAARLYYSYYIHVRKL